jgi:hypothetical protein
MQEIAMLTILNRRKATLEAFPMLTLGMLVSASQLFSNGCANSSAAKPD